MEIIGNLLIYGMHFTLTTIAVVGAVFDPMLGVIACIQLALYYLDANKKFFNKFFVLPGVIFNKNLLSRTYYYRLKFFSFWIAFVVSLGMWVKRLILN